MNYFISKNTDLKCFIINIYEKNIYNHRKKQQLFKKQKTKQKIDGKYIFG